MNRGRKALLKHEHHLLDGKGSSRRGVGINLPAAGNLPAREIGRASCRERV